MPELVSEFKLNRLYNESVKTTTDQSYGVVPVYIKDDKVTVLVVKQISHRGDRFWNFPKGHKEPGENNEAAALRELQEETGLSGVKLNLDQPININYQFVDVDRLVKKTVTYYVGHASNQDTKITEPREVAELRWCSPSEAMTLLTHDNSKRLLKKVLQTLPTSSPLPTHS